MRLGLDGLVGVRGESGRGESEGAGAVDMRFDSLVPAFSSTLWAMDSQLEERSVWTVHCERVEGGRDPSGGTRGCICVSDLPRIEGGWGTWPPLDTLTFAKSTGSSQQRVASVLSDPALDGLCGCEKEGCRVGIWVSPIGGSDFELERRRRKRLMRPPRRRASIAATAKATGETNGVVRSISTLPKSQKALTTDYEGNLVVHIRD